MGAEIIVALLGLCGVALASLLGGLGYYLRSRAERLESRRVVLFYLLEMRHTFLATMFEPKDVLKQYLAYCNKFLEKHGIVGDDSMPDDVREVFLSQLETTRDMVQERLEREVVSPFVSALNEMAKQAPLMAFKIRGKESVNKLIQMQSKYIESLQNSESLSSNAKLSGILASQIDKLKDTNITELANDLSQCIAMVAWSCGLLTYYECRKVLKVEVKSEIDFAEMGLDKFLNDFMQAIQAAAAEEAPAPAPHS